MQCLCSLTLQLLAYTGHNSTEAALPCRRPVLPSSGQAYDEVNIVRHCSQGSKACPVSGAQLKFLRWQLARTPDFSLRNLIVQQAKLAKVSFVSSHFSSSSDLSNFLICFSALKLAARRWRRALSTESMRALGLCRASVALRRSFHRLRIQLPVSELRLPAVAGVLGALRPRGPGGGGDNVPPGGRGQGAGG